MSSSTAQLLQSFEAGDLDPAAFRHLDHIAVAYEMLLQNNFIDASQKYAAGIRSLAEKAGAPGKFNTTITLAFLSLIAERMESNAHRNYDDFIARNPDLTARDVLTKHYSPDRLNSDSARKIFLMPDVGAMI